MKNETILNRIEELETQLRGLNYDNNGNAVNREAAQLIINELDQLEELLYNN